MTKTFIIAAIVVVIMEVFMFREQPTDVNTITPQNCSTDLECEQVAIYVDFDTQASEEAQ